MGGSTIRGRHLPSLLCTRARSSPPPFRGRAFHSLTMLMAHHGLPAFIIHVVAISHSASRDTNEECPLIPRERLRLTVVSKASRSVTGGLVLQPLSHRAPIQKGYRITNLPVGHSNGVYMGADQPMPQRSNRDPILLYQPVP